MDPAEVIAIAQLAAALLQSGATAVQQLLAAHAAGGDLTQLEAIYDRVCAANDILMGNAPATPSVSLATLKANTAPAAVEPEPELPLEPETPAPVAEEEPPVIEPETPPAEEPPVVEEPPIVEPEVQPEAPAAEAETPPPV